MAAGKRKAKEGSAEKAIPALSNIGYFSDYYLTHRLDSGLADLYARWDAAEKLGEPTARTRVRAVSSSLGTLRADASLTAPDELARDTGKLDLGELPRDGREALLALNDEVLDALGWTPERGPAVELTSGDKTLVVPTAHRCDTPTGLLLVALDTVFATDPAAVVANREAPTGRLVEPVLVNGKPAAYAALDAAQLIFTADDPPSYILFASGGAITLLDRDRWGEGISLGANLDEAIARHDTKPKGELAAIAALFSAAALNPGDEAQSVLAGLLERAANESAGVSKELRHGIRRSVEVLANAVVADVRYRQKGAWTMIDPRDLTRQTLRYLYRIIVLLFAEARPELGILPSDDPDYQTGYSMARLRDTALVDLHSDYARNARHLQRSLDVLFRLVNDGHTEEQTLDADDLRELTFPGLRSALFGLGACPLVDQAHLADEVLQQVIANLCFTREKSGQRRQAVSYSTLGINQLGAVYEGLMAYSGFLATEPLFEVDKDGDPDNGSWVIPVDRADEFPEEVFLTEAGLDGATKRVLYEEGDFVFRLSGRDRQRSASYYTPEVLTEFTVRHALDVLFEEHPNVTAAEILELTVCEPALGSGAFLNEAITQLAERYLKAAQDESGETIDAERYQLELQRTKAHFAVNQAYGVDLNQTAVELAEVSVWLNCMYEGLKAPWFGARLRCGNSLIGARRATYTKEQVTNAAWTGKNPVAPTEIPLSETPLGSAEGIHHFLVPGEGWGAAASVQEVKELAPEWAQALNAWRKKIHGRPKQQQIDRLERLATRVEELLTDSAREVEAFWEATRQHIDVWGADTPASGPRFGDGAIREVLENPQSATFRLRTLMDAWCSLWLWAPHHGTELPTLDEWLSAAEGLTRIEEPWHPDTLFADEHELPLASSTSLEEIIEAHPWLLVTRSIARAQSWFHWELEFSPVFARGGFDLQVGNPPWVRLDWKEDVTLAEFDPAIGVASKLTGEELAAHRSRVLGEPTNRQLYVNLRADHVGLTSLCGMTTLWPVLAGMRTNLYFLFMVSTWRRSPPTGVVALLHPESHLSDPKAASLRIATYRRYRKHFHFINELKLFTEISDTREYGVHVYGSDQERARFTQLAFVYHPSVVDRSFTHDGSGDIPGRKLATGEWDLRPHRARVLSVTNDTLSSWAALLAYPEAGSSPIVKSVTTAESAAVDAIARYEHRLGATEFFWTVGFNEVNAVRKGLITQRTDIPASLDEVLLQGPHIGVSTPFAKQARPSGRHQQDYQAWDLESLPESVVPRTNWQRATSREEFARELPAWEGQANTRRYRVIARRQIASNTARSVFAALVPPGPFAVSVCYLGGLRDDQGTVLLAGMMGGLLADFFVRVMGATDLHDNVISRLPIPRTDHPLVDPLIHRTLRLNCMTHQFALLWEAFVSTSWGKDEFTQPDLATRSLAPAPDTWDASVPVRRELNRWLLLCELDALGALIVGVDADGLEAVYRSQFPVLLGYERQMVFDSNGRQLCGDWHQHGYLQAQLEAEAKAQGNRVWTRIWDRVRASIGGDTSVDLGPFVPPFRPADRVAAMRHAYWAFADRYDLTPPDSAERPA